MKSYESGYPRGIATTFELPVSQVQRQLEKFEREGIFASRLVGRTREYRWNPRYLLSRNSEHYWTDSKYESYDLDFVSIADRKKIKQVMESLGFAQD